MESLLPPLTLAAALGCGLIAGVFFAFSSFVMRALARLPRGEGISAMRIDQHYGAAVLQCHGRFDDVVGGRGHALAQTGGGSASGVAKCRAGA